MPVRLGPKDLSYLRDVYCVGGSARRPVAIPRARDDIAMFCLLQGSSCPRICYDVALA